MRHATSAETAGSDALRPLSELGRREARDAAEAMQQRDGRPVMVLSSPRLRARETAEIVSQALGVPMELRSGLDCGATAAAYLDALKPDEGRDVLIVAHNPEISAFATALARQVVSFRPSTVCCIDLTDDSASLAWVRHPNP